MGVTGIRVPLGGSDCVMRSGTSPYWQIDFATLIKAVNEADGGDEVIFPQAIPDGDSTGVSFVLMGTSGNEVLKHSVSLREKAIPSHCLKRLQSAIDRLHAWAEDPHVPQEKRDFCRGFRLPDPKKDPDAYRMTGGMFGRKLHVLWGYEKSGSKSFLPASKVAAKWDDAGNRKNIFQECQGSIWKRIFRIRNLVMSLLFAVGMYWGVIARVSCPVHHCPVGRGLWARLAYESRCPKRCERPDCNRHQDENEKCNAHLCRGGCKRVMPISNNRNGICDECFWTTTR